MSPECATPGQTPTDGAHTKRVTGLFRGLVDQTNPLDPQAWAIVTGTIALLCSLVAIVAAIVRNLWTKGDIGSGACWALAVAVAGLFALAKVNAPFHIPDLPASTQEPS